MAKVINDPIGDFETSWENYSGESIENFLKEKLQNRCGYLYRTPNKIGDYYYIYGFLDYEEFLAWESGEDITPMFRLQLPNIENDTFSVSLSTNSDITKIYNLGDGVFVNLRYTSTKTDVHTGEISDTNNDGTLIIQRSMTGVYIEVGRVNISPKLQGDSSWTRFNLTPFLGDGDQKIRIRVEDNVTGAVSSSVVFSSIVNTKLALRNATDMTKPLNSMALSYYIEGLVAKTLNMKITYPDGTRNTFTNAVSDISYTEVPYTATLSGTFPSGTYSVESWLSVDGTVYESKHITNQFYYIDGQSSESIIVVNDVVSKCETFINTKFLSFTLYNRSSNVRIEIYASGEKFIDYTYNNAETGRVYDFYNSIETESTATVLNATIKITTSTQTLTYPLTIDNSADMNPTVGAIWSLNTKNRNNSEENPEWIEPIAAAKWNGFYFGENDGWLSDSDGNSLLRVPAYESVEFGLNPYDALSESVGATIELDFNVYNVANNTDPILTIGNSVEGRFVGFRMYADSAYFLTTNLQTIADQDIMFQTEARTHIAINIVPNLNNSGLNYIRLFINGIMNREMIYSSSDVISVNNPKIIIGGEAADVDVYGIRVYKKSLSAADVRKDYMASLPTSEEKIAFRSANDILQANGLISYEKCLEKYNTLVWTGDVPSYVTGNVKYKGDLLINIIGDPDHSGTLTNMEIKGQGTSSRGYWKWNHEWKFKNAETSLWTDGNGNLQGSFYKLNTGDRKIQKLCSKLNWASSMQSHKMGSCKLYNDLWKAIVGGNSISKTSGYTGARVAINEVPFLYFVKATPAAEPIFYGLVTMGSAKSDDNTFGYVKNRWPQYLAIEGSDNGMPLTLHQVPWIDEEVTYDEDEEYYVYAGAGQWDYMRGNQNNITYFRDANNFVYLHSTRLKTWVNGEKDKSYQYVKSNGDIFRYDYISETWVDGGITCVTPCSYHMDGKNKVIDVYPVYETLNANTQMGTSSFTIDSLKAWRIQDFKNNVANYYNVNDTLYTMTFCKMVAASDNRCKNTYEYLDPTTRKICFLQDDLDTIFLTDNVGRKTKPYYLEEHDLDSSNATFWNGEDNVFYNLMEEAFPTEQIAMLKSILDTMATDAFGGSIEGCLQKYYFSTQEYFPSVAYNETARLLYEEASVAQAEHRYTNSTPAITQALGDQLQAEKNWWKWRIPYLQSLASVKPFYVRASNGLSFRSLLTPGGARPNYSFGVIPYIWLYPKVGVGQSLGSDTARVPAGQTYNTINVTADGNTDIYIYGADYYKSFGNFTAKSLAATFELTGKHLEVFEAPKGSGTDGGNFRPVAMTINCPVLKTLNLAGQKSIGGSMNLSKCNKLQVVNLSGCDGLSSIYFPQTNSLRSITWPYYNSSARNLRSFTLIGCPNLDNASKTLNGATLSNITSFTTDGSLSGDTIAKICHDSATTLSEMHLIRANFEVTSESLSLDLLSALCKSGSTATGNITLGCKMTNEQKTALINKFGDIDDPGNDLYLVYQFDRQDTITISGDNLLLNGASTEYTVSYLPNDFISSTWTVTGAASWQKINNYKISVVAKNFDSTITIGCTIKRIGAKDVSATKTVDVQVATPITAVAINKSGITGTGKKTFSYTVGPKWNIPVTSVVANFTDVPTGVEILNVAASQLTSLGTLQGTITFDVNTFTASFNNYANLNLTVNLSTGTSVSTTAKVWFIKEFDKTTYQGSTLGVVEGESGYLPSLKIGTGDLWCAYESSNAEHLFEPGISSIQGASYSITNNLARGGYSTVVEYAGGATVSGSGFEGSGVSVTVNQALDDYICNISLSADNTFNDSSEVNANITIPITFTDRDPVNDGLITTNSSIILKTCPYYYAYYEPLIIRATTGGVALRWFNGSTYEYLISDTYRTDQTWIEAQKFTKGLPVYGSATYGYGELRIPNGKTAYLRQKTYNSAATLNSDGSISGGRVQLLNVAPENSDALAGIQWAGSLLGLLKDHGASGGNLAGIFKYRSSNGSDWNGTSATLNNKLKTLPKLPKDYVVNNAYRSIFEGQSDVVAMSGNTISGTSYLQSNNTDLSQNTYVYESMFKDCTSLTSVPVIATSTRTNVAANAWNNMFSGCTALKQITLYTRVRSDRLNGIFTDSSITAVNGTYYPVSSTSTDGNLFCQPIRSTATKLFDIVQGPDITTAYVFGEMYMNCTSLTTAPTFKNTLISSLYQTFNGCTSLTIPATFDNCVFQTPVYSSTPSDYNNMKNMYQRCTALASFNNSNYWPSFDHTADTSATGGTNGYMLGQNMFNCMFLNCTALTSFTGPNIGTLRYGNDVILSMFQGCTKLETVRDFNIIGENGSNSSITQSLSGVFYNCRKLTTFVNSRIELSKVTSFTDMFNQCLLLENPLPIHIRSKKTGTLDCKTMFKGCAKLVCPNLTFDKTSTTFTADSESFLNTTEMFNGCESMTNLNPNGVTGFCGLDFYTAYDGKQTFANCKKLQSLPTYTVYFTGTLSSYNLYFYLLGTNCSTPVDLSNVTVDFNMATSSNTISYGAIFGSTGYLANISKTPSMSGKTNATVTIDSTLLPTTLTEVDLSGFNKFGEAQTSSSRSDTHLTTGGLAKVFSGRTSLKKVKFGFTDSASSSDYRISSLYQTFMGCTGLETVEGLDYIGELGDCYKAFNGCTSLASITIPNPTYRTIGYYQEQFGNMFEGCTSLRSVVFKPETLYGTTTSGHCFTYMFNQCSSLNSITFMVADVGSIESYHCNRIFYQGLPGSGTLIVPEGNNTLAKYKPSGWAVQVIVP